jgi:hypothetical protein
MHDIDPTGGCLSSFDQELPTECDDEYWETSEPNKSFVQPEGKPALISAWIQVIKLGDIISFAQSTIVCQFLLVECIPFTICTVHHQT